MQCKIDQNWSVISDKYKGKLLRVWNSVSTRDSKESRKIWNFHFDLQLFPTVPNGTFLYCQETGIITQKTQKC